MARQKKSKFINLIIWLLLLLLLTGGVGAVAHFSGIGKDDITDMVAPVFRVEYDGKAYKADAENVLELPESGQARFEVKCANAYTVAVVPNVTAETDFNYTANGKTYPYSGEKDLTKVFDLKQYDGYFVLNCNNGNSLESVLSKIWGTETVEIKNVVINNPYKFVVTSSSGETVEILFGGKNVYSIAPILDKTEIVF